MLPPLIEVRLAAGRPAERLMRAHRLEWLPAIPAQNAFCGPVGDRARHRYGLVSIVLLALEGGASSMSAHFAPFRQMQPALGEPFLFPNLKQGR